MKEKERIIELVRKNIITMDEALALLEAAGEAQLQAEFEESISDVDETISNQPQDQIDQSNPYVADYLSGQAQVEQNSCEFKENSSPENNSNPQDQNQVLSEELQKLQNQLTIVRQRIREIEVLAELDDLTDTIRQQRAQLYEEEEILAGKIDKINQTINSNNDNESLEEEADSFEEFIENQARNLGEKAEGFKKTASRQAQGFTKSLVREGKKVGRYVRDIANDFASNFKMKDVEVNVSVPWVKEESIDHEIIFDPDKSRSVTDLDITASNGDVEVKTHPEDFIKLKCKFNFYGNHDDISNEAFLKQNPILIEDSSLKIYEKKKNFGLDVKIYLPEREYKSFKLLSIDGECKLKKLTAQQITLKSTNSNIDIKKTSSDHLKIDLVNGNVEIKDSSIKRIESKNINGDYRIQGPVLNNQIETVNGNIYVTKTSLDESDIIAKTVNGNIKVSVPNQINYKAFGKVSRGQVKNRMSDLTFTDETNKRNIQLERTRSEFSSYVRLDLSTSIGDIYLKDC